MSKAINQKLYTDPGFRFRLAFATTIGVLTTIHHTFQTFAFTGIKNPATGNLGNDPATAKSGAMFVSIFISLWNTAISVGAIITIVMFLWGSLEWITASGDTGKVTKGQQKMLQAALGLFVLVSSFIIIGFVSSILFGTEFDILRPQFFAPGDGS